MRYFAGVILSNKGVKDMSNLIRMEFYKLRHRIFYWLALLGLIIYGFTGAQEYIDFASYSTVKWDDIAVTSFSGLYNSMTADSLMLIALMAGLMAFTIRSGIGS